MEKISAFMDGETAQAETQQTIARLKQNGEVYETWATFHLIGDTLRGDCGLSDGFAARFHARMEREPTQLAPRVTLRKTLNYALSAAASLCAIAVVAALVLTDNPLRPQVQIAASPPPAPTTPEVARVADARPTAMTRQGKVNEYLMAHQEYSPSTAFQGVAPYVRTVSETHDGSGR